MDARWVGAPLWPVAKRSDIVSWAWAELRSSPVGVQTVNRGADNVAQGLRGSRFCQGRACRRLNNAVCKRVHQLASLRNMPHRKNSVIGLGLPWVALLP